MKILMVMLLVPLLISACSKKEPKSQEFGGVNVQDGSSVFVVEVDSDDRDVTKNETVVRGDVKPVVDAAEQGLKSSEVPPMTSKIKLIAPKDIMVIQKVVDFDGETQVVTLASQDGKQTEFSLSADIAQREIAAGDEVVTVLKQTAELFLIADTAKVVDPVMAVDVIKEIKQTQRMDVQLISLDAKKALVSLKGEEEYSFALQNPVEVSLLKVGSLYQLQLMEDLVISLAHAK